ncbi:MULTISPECIES: hypothetical protein [unclassified Duganella]|uniref:hypothetical protein n=1 Tax=unclassified Duganella TaxID=2636909 RepID=UPI000A962013|nr:MULTISPECIES: hypothetical protein [unclassified Duganella]
MNELIPGDLEADSTASVDGLTYTVSIIHDETGYRAHLTWRDRVEQQTTPPFSNARSAMIEGHSLAEEYILAWRSHS